MEEEIISEAHVVETPIAPEAPVVETPAPVVEKTVPLSVLIAERQKRQEAQRQLDLLSTRQAQPQQEQAKPDEDPMPDDGDPVKLGAWGARQEFKRLEGNRQAETRANAEQSRAEKGLSTVKNTAARLSVEDPEFDTKLEIARSKGMDFPVTHEILIGESSDPAAMLKFLIANPAEAVRIQSLDVVGAARELTRLEGKLTQPENKPKKSPPPPIETARGGKKPELTGVEATAARLFPMS